MTKRAFLGFITTAMIAATCGSQTAPASKTPISTQDAGRHPIPVDLVCPDPRAKQSCESYRELVEANDKELPSRIDDRYFCFRQEADQFFAVAFSKPLPTKWDEERKQLVVDEASSSPGSGFAETFSNGVQDSRVVPYVFFSGTWHSYLGAWHFASDTLNFKKEDSSRMPGVTISDSQVAIQYKYENSSNVKIRYTLTIQRSTGRFAEEFQGELKSAAYSNTGRCIYLKAE